MGKEMTFKKQQIDKNKFLFVGTEWNKLEWKGMKGD